MDIFNTSFSWHPRLQISTLTPELSRILSETRAIIIDTKKLDLLNQFFHSGLSFKQWINIETNKNDININQKTELIQQVETLHHNGYLKTPADSTSLYITPNYQQQPITLNKFNYWQQIHILSSINRHEKVLGWLQNTICPKNTHLVIVDDYLDPRLAQINRDFLQHNKNWLLMKITGARSMIGPYFCNDATHSTTSPSDKESNFCWQCLNHYMSRNASLRLLNYQNGIAQQTKPLPVPILIDQQSIDHRITIIENNLLLSHLFERKNVIFEIDNSSHHPISHEVIKRPQCPCCGDKNLFSNQVNQPITLRNTTKSNYSDGGIRTVNARNTVRKLRPFISPVCGIFSHLNTRSPNEKNHSVIYRSGFGVMPLNINHLTSHLSHLSFSYTATGKGISIDQSQASALSEAIERLAAHYQGDEPCFLAAAQNKKNYYLPAKLTPFSEKQFQIFKQKQPNTQSYRIEQSNHQTQLYWTPIWSMRDQCHKYVPFNYCYANAPHNQQQYSRFYHNGGSAGNNLEEAILQGFLEIVSRDAVSIWWYNQIQSQGVDFSTINETLLTQLNHTIGQGWEYWALDLTHDFNIPVIAAISQHKKTAAISFGFGAHLDPKIACERAFTELFQISEIRDNHSAPFNFDEIKLKDFLLPKNAKLKPLCDFYHPNHHDIKDDINYCINKATQLNLDTLVLNYSRADLPLATAKVIIPGCCHLSGFNAAERLYQVPVDLGWFKQAKQEHQLNPQPLLI